MERRRDRPLSPIAAAVHCSLTTNNCLALRVFRTQPCAFRLQQLPRPRDVLLFRADVANRQMHDVAAVQLGVRQEYLARGIDGIQHALVEIIPLLFRHTLRTGAEVDWY